MTYYAHCSSVNVKKGQKVQVGEIIAQVGHSGNAHSDHLHFELHKNVDPNNSASNWNATAIDPGQFILIPPYLKRSKPEEKIA